MIRTLSRRGRHAAPGRAAVAARRASAATAIAASVVSVGAAGSAHAAATTEAPPATAEGLASRLTSALPVQGAATQTLSSVSAPSQTVSHLLHDGAVGTLTQHVAPQAQALAGGVVYQASPLVDPLRRSGVPTVGELTSQVGQAQLPVVGGVDQLTQSLPVDSALVGEPLTGALRNLSTL